MGSKNLVLMFRSVNNIVMAPASTGRDSNSRTAVIFTLHTNSGIRSIIMPLERILMIVVMKLMDPRMDDTPAR